MLKALVFAISLNVTLMGQGSDARVTSVPYRPVSQEWHVNVVDPENRLGYVFDTDGELEMIMEF